MHYYYYPYFYYCLSHSSGQINITSSFFWSTAFRLTWVSLLFEVAGATGGIIGFVQTESSLILAFALENIVDLLSSSVVLWRFYAPNGSDEAQLAKLKAREERANVRTQQLFLFDTY